MTLSGSISFGATTFAASTTFLTLSTGFRPPVALEFITNFFDASPSGQVLARVGILTNGQIQIVQAWTLTGWTGADPLPTGNGDSLNLNISFNT